MKARSNPFVPTALSRHPERSEGSRHGGSLPTARSFAPLMMTRRSVEKHGFRPFVPSSLRPFVPSSLRAFVPSCFKSNPSRYKQPVRSLRGHTIDPHAHQVARSNVAGFEVDVEVPLAPPVADAGVVGGV